MNKTLLSGLTIAALGLVAVPSTQAASIKLFDEATATTIQINDGDALDTLPGTGAVGFSGSIGVFTFTLAGGQTKPPLGSATQPELLLAVTASSSSSGKLEVSFSEQGFGPSALTATARILGGIADTPSTYATFQSAANTLFGTTTPLTSQPFGPGLFGASSAFGSLATGSAPYSLTQTITINHDSDGGFSMVGARLSVPDGGLAVGLLGFALLGVEGLRRRFSRPRAEANRRV